MDVKSSRETSEIQLSRKHELLHAFRAPFSGHRRPVIRLGDLQSYLIPLVDKDGQFIIAGLPRSPGYEAATPERPAIYPWNEDTQKQLKKLGIEP